MADTSFPEIIKYQVPAFLDFTRLSKKDDGTYLLAMMGSPKRGFDLETDSKGYQLIKACINPKTTLELAAELQLTESEVEHNLRRLVKHGILYECYDVPQPYDRYHRHLLFYQLAGGAPIQVQNKISQSRVALIGMGGIGNWVSLAMIGAGLRELVLIDFDVVELTNLTRQILFRESDIGNPKIEAAARELKGRNSQTKITQISENVSSAESLISKLDGVDFVVLSADRPFEIHEWVDDACRELAIPYTTLGYRGDIGVVGPLTLHGKTACHYCNYSPPSQDQEASFDKAEFDIMFNRHKAPSFGPLNAIVSSIGATEVIKYIGGIGMCASLGVEMNIDPLTMKITNHKLPKNSECTKCCGSNNVK